MQHNDDASTFIEHLGYAVRVGRMAMMAAMNERDIAASAIELHFADIEDAIDSWLDRPKAAA
ncbi:hypothetical protein [Pleomorphomonas carboxyditropha]|uniref:hypothetical protein n=1 Tax=Pleomorphomonas carboxyditropha TaxID=2023338 RepID=UPI00105539BD|nr:hypothetical protein [Pleomorphomonas carboxyditropha]